MFGLTSAARADLSKVTVTTGAGDKVVVKHGLFGRKTTIVKDRFGDGFASSKGILGTKNTEVNVLGNRVHSHKGILGTSETSGQTILGDSFQSHKGLLGRDTNINLSGVNSLLNRYLSPKSTDGSSQLPKLAPDFKSMPAPNNQSDLNRPAVNPAQTTTGSPGN